MTLLSFRPLLAIAPVERYKEDYGALPACFRRDGQDDRSEYRFNDPDGQPEIDGRPIVDGETYVIRGVEWLVHREDSGDFQLHSKDSRNLPRFICTLVVEPTA